MYDEFSNMLENMPATAAEVAEAACAAAAAVAEQQAAADAQAARAGGLRIEGFPAEDAADRGGLYARDAEEPTANGFAHFVHASSKAGLDEGLLSLSLPHSCLYAEQPYEQHINENNDRTPSYIHRPRTA